LLTEEPKITPLPDHSGVKNSRAEKATGSEQKMKIIFSRIVRRVRRVKDPKNQGTNISILYFDNYWSLLCGPCVL
jgi:hypothetical protein